MTIKQKENEFFLKHPSGFKNIVRDGVVEEDSYLSSNPKILFLLKEVNSPGESGWSLIEKICSHDPVPMLDTLARWMIGIRSLPKVVPWSDVKKISVDTRISVLNYVVLFNLKKTPGGRTTNEKELTAHALEFSVQLNEQFLFYNPDIVICCGNATSRLFDKILSPNNTPWPDISYREFRPKKYVIAYNHPQARVNKERQYYGIVNAVKEILNKKN
jgi:hypothetical protein